MTIEDEVLIHVGYPKTGTTWLQQKYFNNPNSGFFLFPDRNKISKMLVVPHPFDFNPNQHYSYFEENINIAKQQQLYPVISFERFVGNPYHGGFDSKEIAQRLSAIFPKAKILIVIREQIDIILSAYNTYVKQGGVMSLSTFLKSSFSINARGFEKAYFRYHRLIQFYHQLFGKNRVLTLAYEQFKASPSIFIQDILSFCKLHHNNSSSFQFNIKKNESLTPCLSEINAKLNRFIHGRTNYNPEPLIVSNRKKFFRPYILKINERLPHHIKQKSIIKAKNTIQKTVNDFYKESNQETMKLTRIPLNQYGYHI